MKRQKIMRPLKGQSFTHFQWVQTGDLDSELIAEDSNEPFATLKWAKRWGSLATGEASDGKWTFKRVGFLHPKVTVRESESTAETAVFSLTWAGDGVLEILSEATKFSFKRTSMWHSEWFLKRNDANEIILTIKPDLNQTSSPSKRKISAEVEFGQNALEEQRLSLLALIAWYVIILMTYDDYSSYVGGITAAIVSSTIV
jgi:hypothetical protein